MYSDRASPNTIKSHFENYCIKAMKRCGWNSIIERWLWKWFTSAERLFMNAVHECINKQNKLGKYLTKVGECSIITASITLLHIWTLAHFVSHNSHLRLIECAKMRTTINQQIFCKRYNILSMRWHSSSDSFFKNIRCIAEMKTEVCSVEFDTQKWCKQTSE